MFKTLFPSPFQILHVICNDLAADFNFNQAHIRNSSDGVFLAFGDVGYVSASDIADMTVDHDITDTIDDRPCCAQSPWRSFCP